MFEGFEQRMIDTGEVSIRVRTAGDGPPLLMIHGNPQTQAMWSLIAPSLAEDYTVVLTDLRGYGESSKPETVADHATYSKRAMARDQVAVMSELGFDRFRVAGHDRGGRCAYRLALDHPDRVEKLAVLDIIPTGEAFWRADRDFGMGYWHWFFLAQPQDLPERMIGADPEYFWRALTGGIAGDRNAFAPEALEEYLRWFRDPASIHAMCEDYRAGAAIDLEHDRADRDAGRRIACPMLALWGAKGMLARWYDVLDVWRGWSGDVRGRALDCGHFLPEEAPEETLAEFRAFFAS